MDGSGAGATVATGQRATQRNDFIKATELQQITKQLDQVGGSSEDYVRSIDRDGFQLAAEYKRQPTRLAHPRPSNTCVRVPSIAGRAAHMSR